MQINRPLLIRVVLPLAIGVATLLVISLMRGSSSKILVDAATLRKTHTTWTNRNFVLCSDRQLLLETLDSLLTSQSLDDSQRASARDLAVNFIQSLAKNDWEQFRDARIPLPGYKISEEVQEALSEYSGLSPKGAGPLQMYETLWKATFKDKPLFSAVSFTTNSATLLNPATFPPGNIAFPDVFQKSEQNWLEITPTTAFDYSSIFDHRSPEFKPPIVLRLFFFAKCPDPEGARPFMLSALWDEKSNRWIPWELKHASVRPPTHKIRFF